MKSFQVIRKGIRKGLTLRTYEAGASAQEETGKEVKGITEERISGSGRPGFFRMKMA